mgnify:CR=1 FL=1
MFRSVNKNFHEYFWMVNRNFSMINSSNFYELYKLIWWDILLQQPKTPSRTWSQTQNLNPSEITTHRSSLLKLLNNHHFYLLIACGLAIEMEAWLPGFPHWCLTSPTPSSVSTWMRTHIKAVSTCFHTTLNTLKSCSTMSMSAPLCIPENS